MIDRLRHFLATSGLLSLAWLVTTGPCFAEFDNTPFREKFDAIQSELAPHYDDLWPSLKDDEPATLQLWRKATSVLREWAVAYLSAHPSATPEEFTSAVIVNETTGYLGRDINYSEMARLGPTSYLVKLDFGLVPDIFVIEPRHGHLQIVWVLLGSRKKGPYEKYLSFWAPPIPNTGTIAEANIGKLTDDAEGNHRFFINAHYQQAAGHILSSQFSIWKMNLNLATPVLIKKYQEDAESPLPFFDGKFIDIEGESPYKTFSSNYLYELQIQVGPNFTRDLGRTPRNQKIYLIDTLFDRIQRHQGWRDLALPAAATVLTPIAQKFKTAEPSLDELNARSSDTTYCATFEREWIDPPSTKNSVLFFFKRVGTHLYISNAKDLRAADCVPSKE